MAGIVIWEGPSEFDARVPIVAIATGLGGESANAKTGPMVQVWVLRQDMSPIEAVRTDADGAICGTCRHRGGPGGKLRTCYVNVAWAPQGVWRAYKRDKYPRVNPTDAARTLAGTTVRLTAYGDPAAVPIAVWHAVLEHVAGTRGYTHHWQTANPALLRYCMASADTPGEARAARALGYRYYRDRLPGEPLLEREFVCPASDEAGHQSSCNECTACSGTRDGDKRKDPVIYFHGPATARHTSRRRYSDHQLTAFAPTYVAPPTHLPKRAPAVRRSPAANRTLPLL